MIPRVSTSPTRHLMTTTTLSESRATTLPKDRTLVEALALADTIACNAPIAVRESLKIARRTFDLDDAALARLSEEGQQRVMRTEDFQEGPRAFIEKRTPRWVGR